LLFAFVPLQNAVRGKMPARDNDSRHQIDQLAMGVPSIVHPLQNVTMVDDLSAMFCST
jgi:hypothetical protein